MDGRSLLEAVEASIDENEILDEAAREIAEDAESGSITTILFDDAVISTIPDGGVPRITPRL